jgi:hypothetical protein
MIKLKVSYASGHVSLANQRATLGLASHGEVAIYGVLRVPPGTPAGEVAHAARDVVLLRREPWEIGFEELQRGAVVR